VVGRDEIEGLGPALAAGLLERLRAEALVVDGKALEPQVQQPRHRLHPRVGQRLRQQEIPRLEQRGEDDREAVLAPRADEHVGGRRLDPGPSDPGRAGLAVRSIPPGGRVVEEPPHVPPHGDVSERGEQGRPLGERRRVRRVVLPQVHEASRVRALAVGVARAAHECPPAHLAAHQTAPGGLRVGAAHRADGDAETLGEVAVGWQTAALSQLSRREILDEPLDNPQIARPLLPLELRDPDCHGDNIAIDTSKYQL
jgi:hypothetical protein